MACGKVFAKSLKTLKLHEGSHEHYNACPYCLTEITNAENENKNTPKETVTEATIFKEEPAQKEEKTLSCKYHRGYLSEKEHKQQISEECMVCKELIECMHKK
jgi:hypothetical protein